MTDESQTADTRVIALVHPEYESKYLTVFSVPVIVVTGLAGRDSSEIDAIAEPIVADISDYTIDIHDARTLLLNKLHEAGFTADEHGICVY